MAIAPSVSNFLTAHKISYRVIPHPYTQSSAESATAADIAPARVAKGVLVRDRDGSRFMLAVLPASRQLSLHRLEEIVDRRLRLAEEGELNSVFPDCRLGAVPALGGAYGLNTIIDTHLDREREVYVEAGDHEDLIQLENAQFEELVGDCHHANISTEPEGVWRR